MHEIVVFLNGLSKISTLIRIRVFDFVYLDESSKEFFGLGRRIVYCNDMNGLGLGRHSVDSSRDTCKYRTIEEDRSKNDEVLDSFSFTDNPLWVG